MHLRLLSILYLTGIKSTLKSSCLHFLNTLANFIHYKYFNSYYRDLNRTAQLRV